eukprot:GHVU01065603.1.p1 GENE.GHVU01065603.1~~GHVU01065603.1.p1  ORF type:complete len:133 (+),score=0.42 GHVU01065603.1:196-594(+)
MVVAALYDIRSLYLSRIAAVKREQLQFALDADCAGIFLDRRSWVGTQLKRQRRRGHGSGGVLVCRYTRDVSSISVYRMAVGVISHVTTSVYSLFPISSLCCFALLFHFFFIYFQFCLFFRTVPYGHVAVPRV